MTRVGDAEPLPSGRPGIRVLRFVADRAIGRDGGRLVGGVFFTLFSTVLAARPVLLGGFAVPERPFR